MVGYQTDGSDMKLVPISHIKTKVILLSIHSALLSRVWISPWMLKSSLLCHDVIYRLYIMSCS